MPTRTARPARTGTRTSTPSRSAASRRRSTPKRSTPKRTGVAGGWLQRRQAPTSRKSKAVGALKRGLPSGKKGSSAGVAAGLALLGAAGVALRKRTGGDHSSDVPATPTTTPVTPAAPATNVTSTPSTATSPSTDTEFPPNN